MDAGINTPEQVGPRSYALLGPTHRTAPHQKKMKISHQDQEYFQNFQNRVGDKFKMLLT